MFNVTKLRGRIIEVYGTLGAFAENAGCSRGYLSLYMNHKAILDQDTILKWAGLLHISDDQIPAYFFATEVDETEPTEG